MSNLNNYAFANILNDFKKRYLDIQKGKVEKAMRIMDDPNYQWKDEAQKVAGKKQLEIYKVILADYETFYNEGNRLCVEHENLTNILCKLYDRWYNEVSNNGKQEKEMLSYQSDVLNEIFSELYKELKVLNLDIKPPAALNLT